MTLTGTGFISFNQGLLKFYTSGKDSIDSLSILLLKVVLGIFKIFAALETLLPDLLNAQSIISLFLG